MTAFTMAPPQQSSSHRRSPTGGYQRIPGHSGAGFMPAPTAAALGRGGDSELAHVNPAEKQMLESMGGSGTRNPATGLPEYVNPALIPAFAMAGQAMAGGQQRPAGGRHAAMHQQPGVGTPMGADRNVMGQQLLQAVLSGKFGG